MKLIRAGLEVHAKAAADAVLVGVFARASFTRPSGSRPRRREFDRSAA